MAGVFPGVVAQVYVCLDMDSLVLRSLGQSVKLWSAMLRISVT